MSDERASSGARGLSGRDERQALGRVYSLARRSALERVAVDPEMERRLAVVVLYCFSAEKLACGSDDDEAALAQWCADWLVAKTVTGTSRGLR